MAGSRKSTPKTSAIGNGTGYLKKSLSHFQPIKLKRVYEFVDQLAKTFPVSFVCKVLKISRSAYYAYQSGESHQMSSEQRYELAQVEKAFRVHKRRYGSRRLVAELQDNRRSYWPKESQKFDATTRLGSHSTAAAARPGALSLEPRIAAMVS